MLVDLATPKFWFFVVAAILLLTPIAHAVARRAVFAGVNLLFLASILTHQGFLEVLVGFAVVYAILQAAARPGPRPAAVAIGLIGCCALFVLHKLPRTAGHLPVLALIGYSYVFLRLIDVLRATWESRTVAPTPIQLVNYLTPFHMLAAGPIQAWDEFIAQPAVPEPLTFNQSLSMIERIVHGLFKKYVLAYAVKTIFLTDSRARGWYTLVEMNMMYLWLFLDFSAYSDIAVGIGGLMGIATPENFNKPYIARNVTDFWERWHISLSMWIRRNLFFPIQIALVRRTAGRYALLCAAISIMISFFLCGIWHGLTPPFLIWGIMQGLGLVACNLYRYWLKKRLGSKGVARYMASWPIYLLAAVVTFEFAAFSILVEFSNWIYK